MSAKPHRLDSLLQIARNKEQQAAAKLAQANAALQEQQQRMTQLDSYGNEYRQQLQTRADRGINGSMLRSHVGFLSQLDKLRSGQQQQLEQHNTTRSSAYEDWLTANKRVQSLEKAIEKDQRNAQRVAERREERQAEEWSQRHGKSNT